MLVLSKMQSLRKLRAAEAPVVRSPIVASARVFVTVYAITVSLPSINWVWYSCSELSFYIVTLLLFSTPKTDKTHSSALNVKGIGVRAAEISEINI